jgi:hypothetical protein
MTWLMLFVVMSSIVMGLHWAVPGWVWPVSFGCTMAGMLEMVRELLGEEQQ